MLRKVNVIRYVSPLREGGSLPAIAEADDDFLYVLKFRGAGQGPKALIAEMIGSEIARSLGMRVPEVVFAHLEEGFGRMERDEEIQDLLKFSVGLNLGLHFLSGAITYDSTVHTVDSDIASMIVWLDSLLMNMDRTAKNTNMLIWNRQLWLIDHGASLYFHHGHTDWQEQAIRPFALIKDHVLLRYATAMESADAKAKALLSDAKIKEIISWLPDDWFEAGVDPILQKARYVEYFTTRLAHSDILIQEVHHARATRF